MSPLTPLQLTVEAKGWSCVLDLRLALSRFGLTLAFRLAEEMKVHVVPTFGEVLDNPAYYERNPGYLAADPLFPGETYAESDLRAALAQWQMARFRLDPPALRVYWTADSLHKSALPQEVDAGVLGRFERLAEGLQRRLTAMQPDLEPGHPLLDGSCDAVALAAALARYRPLILTLGRDGNRVEPLLCSLLRFCGIPCQALEPRHTHSSRAYLRSLLVRCGVLELTWAGLSLAVVHLVAPRSFLMPPVAGETSDVPGHSSKVENCWQDAAAFWYTLP